MIRARLPLLGAAVLLAAPAALAQAPPLVVYPSGLHVIVVAPNLVPSESLDLSLDSMAEGRLISFEPDAPADAARLKPKAQQTTEPPCSTCVEEIEEFPSFCCLPFAAPPPPPPPAGHKCRFRHKSCQNGSNGQGYGNPYLGWPYAGAGYPGCYGASPYASNGSSCRRCQHKHHQAPSGPPYPGYGYPYQMGCSTPWGGNGYAGFNNDGCFGYCPPPYAPPQTGHKCFRKHGCSNNGPCPRCGYPGYSSPSGSWGYPVGGWSTANDGYNGFLDPNCLPGKKHCHGLFHRCHSCKQTPPPPCFNPYWQQQAWQPCMDMAWDDADGAIME
jgi:hypothetical protein